MIGRKRPDLPAVIPRRACQAFLRLLGGGEFTQEPESGTDHHQHGDDREQVDGHAPLLVRLLVLAPDHGAQPPAGRVIENSSLTSA